MAVTIDQLAAQVQLLSNAISSLKHQNHNESSSDEESSWNDLVNSEKQPEDSAFLVSRMSNVPPFALVKELVDNSPHYSGIPKTPNLTRGDDKKLVLTHRKLEASLNLLTELVEEGSDPDSAKENALKLGAVLRSCFDDVTQLRRLHVVKGHYGCLTPNTEGNTLLTNDEFKRLSISRAKKSQNTRNPRQNSRPRQWKGVRTSSFRSSSRPRTQGGFQRKKDSSNGKNRKTPMERD